MYRYDQHDHQIIKERIAQYRDQDVAACRTS